MKLIFPRSILTYVNEDAVKREVGVDVLIIADGCFSSLRSPLLNLHHNSTQHNLADEDIITHRGYRVYRGFLEGNDEVKKTTKDMVSHQAWGPGARFAVVPTVDGIAWFLAMSIHRLPSVSSEEYSSNGARSINNTPDYGALINLLAKQNNAHKNILNSVLNTKEEDIIVNEAWAFRQPQPLLLSGFALQNKERGPLILFAGDAAHTVS